MWIGTVVLLLLATIYVTAEWYVATIFFLSYLATSYTEHVAKRGTSTPRLNEKIRRRNKFRFLGYSVFSNEIFRFAVFGLIVVVIGSIGALFEEASSQFYLADTNFPFTVPLFSALLPLC